MYEHLLFEVDENSIGTLTINKERAMNTLSLETLTELHQFTQNELLNSGLKVLIVTGAGGKAFVAGADIGYAKSLWHPDRMRSQIPSAGKESRH